MQQMLLKLAVPSGITLEILTKKAALEKIRQDQSEEKVLLIMRNPAEANAFLEMGFSIDRINVGNISNSKSVTGRKKILNYIYLEPQDAEALQARPTKASRWMCGRFPASVPVMDWSCWQNTQRCKTTISVQSK